MNNRISVLLKGLLVLALSMGVAGVQAETIIEHSVYNDGVQGEKIHDLCFSKTQIPQFHGNLRLADGIVHKVRSSSDFVKFYLRPVHTFESVIEHFDNYLQRCESTGSANCLPPGPSLFITIRRIQV